MSRLINNKNQINIWGRQSDPSNPQPLEPQRVDLFIVDFTSAVAGVAQHAKLPAVTMKPQYARSVSFPEIKIKPEVFPRDSIPYHMPGADECIEAVKINFVLDTGDESDKSVVLDFLDAWIGLTRAGRGARYRGYKNDLSYFVLDSNYTVNFRFDFIVALLRGIPPEADVFTSNAGDMTKHMLWIFRAAWCAGYKITDLNYNDSGLVCVEALFYPETVERSKDLNIFGQPLTVDQANKTAEQSSRTSQLFDAPRTLDPSITNTV